MKALVGFQQRYLRPSPNIMMNIDRFASTLNCCTLLEVGEHIPAELEAKFLNNLSSSARRMVILTWAVPGQVILASDWSMS